MLADSVFSWDKAVFELVKVRAKAKIKETIILIFIVDAPNIAN